MGKKERQSSKQFSFRYQQFITIVYWYTVISEFIWSASLSWFSLIETPTLFFAFFHPPGRDKKSNCSQCFNVCRGLFLYLPSPTGHPFITSLSPALILFPCSLLSPGINLCACAHTCVCMCACQREFIWISLQSLPITQVINQPGWWSSFPLVPPQVQMLTPPPGGPGYTQNGSGIWTQRVRPQVWPRFSLSRQNETNLKWRLCKTSWACSYLTWCFANWLDWAVTRPVSNLTASNSVSIRNYKCWRRNMETCPLKMIVCTIYRSSFLKLS